MDDSHQKSAPDERGSLIAEIHNAFGDVDRRHAVSWNECEARDSYAGEAACAAARRSDLDTHWRELINDPTWQPFPGTGGFSFIDAPGFRYYLPPTMIRFVRGDVTEWYEGHLLGVIERFTDEHAELFTARMFAVIARFMAFMSREEQWPESQAAWRSALAGGWGRYLPSADQPSQS